MNCKLSLLAALFVLSTACVTAPSRPAITPWHGGEVNNYKLYGQDMWLPREIAALVITANATVSDDRADALSAIASYFNERTKGTAWVLREIAKEEEQWQPMACKCSCGYLMLTNDSDRENRWLVTLTGCQHKPSFTPWRFKHENYRKINPTAAFPLKFDLGYTIQEMVAMGQFDTIRPPKELKFAETDFPVTEGLKTATLRLVSLGKRAKTEEALRTIDARGQRPATLGEALAFAAENRQAYIDSQRADIIILGFGYELGLSNILTGQIVDIERYYASMTLGEWRKLSFAEQEPTYGGGWDEYVLFLVADK